MDWYGALVLAYVAFGWVIRVGLGAVIVLTQRAQVAIAWLAVVFLEPYVGLVAYGVLGASPLGRWRVRRHAALRERLERDRGLLGPLERFHPPEEAFEFHRRDFVRLAGGVASGPVVRGNAVSVHAEHGAFLDALESGLEGAERSAHLLYYIFRDDASGGRVTEAVERAAGRGVACRVLVDARGGRGLLESDLGDRLRRAGVEVRAALRANPLRRGLHRIDVRNHRKLALFDGRSALMGSHNVADPEYGRRGVGPWHDLSVSLRGPAVRQLQAVFLVDWWMESGELLEGEAVLPEPGEAGEVLAQAIPSGPDEPVQTFRDLMVDAIHEADERVVLTTPYFVPDEPLLLALKLAARSGLEVRLVVPARSDSRVVNLATRAHFRELLEAGVRLHLHRPGVLHAKTLTADDTMCIVGSGNVDMRSFALNFELSVMLLGSEGVGEVLACQRRYIEESEELGADWDAGGVGRRLARSVARLAGPLL